MLKSMTAYGRVVSTTPLGRFSVEIQSVNRKHLEINAFLPNEFLRYETEIKKWIASSVRRGQINIKITASFDPLSTPIVITPNITLAKQMKAAWDVIGQELYLSPEKSFQLSLIASERDLLIYEQDAEKEESYRELLHELVQQALHQLRAMKLKEGHTLSADIQTRLKKIYDEVQNIASNAPHAPEQYRKKLLSRLNELFSTSLENEERVLREIALFAEKIDITEELTRLGSHLNQVGELLGSSSEDGVGKTFEFLLQEMAREINTISSKSSDIETIKLAIEIKSELERIREQIQNIE